MTHKLRRHVESSAKGAPCIIFRHQKAIKAIIDLPLGLSNGCSIIFYYIQCIQNPPGFFILLQWCCENCFGLHLYSSRSAPSLFVCSQQFPSCSFNVHRSLTGTQADVWAGMSSTTSTQGYIWWLGLARLRAQCMSKFHGCLKLNLPQLSFPPWPGLTNFTAHTCGCWSTDKHCAGLLCRH